MVVKGTLVLVFKFALNNRDVRDGEGLYLPLQYFRKNKDLLGEESLQPPPRFNVFFFLRRNLNDNAIKGGFYLPKNVTKV